MLKRLELKGFKSFAKKSVLEFEGLITAVVGPNGSGKSNVMEAIRFVLGEQSIKSMRGKAGLDLIFKGSKTLPKQNEASVTIIFDNRNKIFKIPNISESINLDFDEISISREVYADGVNRYLINGSEVRLRDILEILASVNIGSSGHHIISQGEADRVLNASLKERRAMVEDALGLKIYQYRIKDSERKLEKTKENMKEVGLLRKEIAPHLNFLKKQVEKVEKAAQMREELSHLYNDYLKREEIYIEEERNNLFKEKSGLQEDLAQIENSLRNLGDVEEHVQDTFISQEVSEIENQVRKIRQVKDELQRKLGRIEGMLELEEKRALPQANEAKEVKQKAVSFSADELEALIAEVDIFIDQALAENDIGSIRGVLERVRITVRKLLPDNLEQGLDISEKVGPDLSQIEEMRNTKEAIDMEIAQLENEEKNLVSKLNELHAQTLAEKDNRREADRVKMDLSMKRNDILSKANFLNLREENLAKLENDFKNEISEGSVLVGAQILGYKNFVVSEPEAREMTEERRRKIERIKIRLEDSGLGGVDDILKEYQEVTERDQFLGKELEDLASSIESLDVLTRELKQKLEVEFMEGVKKINERFDEFFNLVFGGGQASLSVVAEERRKRSGDEEDMADLENEEKEVQYGIDVNVALPHKKTRDLQALSGGERSLTSIALLFAISQVNPPPFLVLDETDAALDEANSRKYGNMLEKLSKYSQLIVVTHNRETMSRANILYGVTIAGDGGSRLLSIKLDEAVSIAK